MKKKQTILSITFLTMIALILPNTVSEVEASSNVEWTIARYKITSSNQFLAIKTYGSTTINVTTYRNWNTREFRHISNVSFKPNSKYPGFTMKVSSIIDSTTNSIVPYVTLYNHKGSYIDSFGTSSAVFADSIETVYLPPGTTPFSLPVPVSYE